MKTVTKRGQRKKLHKLKERKGREAQTPKERLITELVCLIKRNTDIFSVYNTTGKTKALKEDDQAYFFEVAIPKRKNAPNKDRTQVIAVYPNLLRHTALGWRRVTEIIQELGLRNVLEFIDVRTILHGEHHWYRLWLRYIALVRYVHEHQHEISIEPHVPLGREDKIDFPKPQTLKQ